MSDQCRYFESDSWDERRWQFLSQLPVGALLSSLDAEDAARLRDEMSTTASTGHLTKTAKQPIGEFIAMPHADAAVTLEELWHSWHGDTSIPDTCPHTPIESDRCAFHLPPEHEAKPDLSAQLVAAIERGENEFVGGQFSSLTLSQKILSARENEPIDLRYASVESALELNNTIVEQPFLMSGSTFDRITCHGSSFRSRAAFDRISVSESVEFRATEFGYATSFYGTTFPTETIFTKSHFGDDTQFAEVTVGERSSFASTQFGSGTAFTNALFKDQVTFENTEFEGGVVFTGARFGEKTSFESTTFDHGVDLAETTFGDGTTFKNAQFPSGSTFVSAQFGDEVIFANASFGDGTTFAETRTGINATFTHAQFGDGVVFDEATFGAGATFAAADFGRGCSFTKTEFGEGASVSEAEFEVGVEFDRMVVEGVFDMTAALLNGGTFRQPPDEESYYDLTKATIREVTFAEEHVDSPLFDHYLFDRTEFDGFDFTAHSKHFGNEWILHRFRTSRPSSESKFRTFLSRKSLISPGFDPASVRGTYLKAKNGASQIGDGTAHSEFFLREMAFRRLEHREQAFNSDQSFSDRLRAGYNWFAHSIYNLTCGYGERPGRTVIASFGVIGVFTTIYPFLNAQLDGSGFLSYLIFSIQSFVTLLLGGVPDGQPLLVRLFASVEAFLGAFFIALFVFTLTRSLHR